MIKTIKTKRAILLLFASLALLASAAYGQDIPAVTTDPQLGGFSLPDAQSTLTFAVTGSESVRTGYYDAGLIPLSSISGDVAYLSKSSVQPFSAVYSGGYLYSGRSSSGEPSSLFQNLALSQTIFTRLWNFVLSDSVRYLPASSSGGLSGVPGLGDLGVGTPVTGTDTSQDIFTNFSSRVTNDSTLTASHNFTGSTSFQASGDYNIQRFINGTGGTFDSNAVSASGGFNRRIDALNSATLSYTFSRVIYPDNNLSFSTQGLSFGYRREMTRRLTVDASGGPEYTVSSVPGGVGGNSNLNFSADAGFGYLNEFSQISLRYIRGVRSGSGVVEGDLNQGVHFSYNRKLSRLSTTSVTGGYDQNKSLAHVSPTNFSSNSVSGSLQFSRSIGEYLSGYVSYTALKQIYSDSASSSNAFNGFTQVVSIGISYSPRPIHFGHQ